MLATFLGEKSFRAGLHDYLNKFKYSNAKTADLWAALSQVCNVAA
jgi:aminopeptidase N